jgi:hypothetical protein
MGMNERGGEQEGEFFTDVPGIVKCWQKSRGNTCYKKTKFVVDGFVIAKIIKKRG